VAGRGFAGAGAPNQRLDPHHAHQPLHALAVDAVSCSVCGALRTSRDVRLEAVMCVFGLTGLEPSLVFGLYFQSSPTRSETPGQK
jgi:hypothetical protein